MIKNKVFRLFAAILALAGIESRVPKQRENQIQKKEVLGDLADQSALEFLKARGKITWS